MIEFKQFLIEEKVDSQRWEQYLKQNPMLRAAIEVLEILTSLGGEAYIVGGCVRDIILGDPFKDVDIATNVPIDKIEQRFKAHNIGQSKDFGVVTIKHKGHDFEVAQFREDGKYTDGRRPDSVKIVMDFKSDASRRDLTINSAGIDKDGNIIDHFDGQKDIKNKIVRTVGNPLDRFEEDRLRMLRTVRFASKLDFTIDDKTTQALKQFAPKIKDVSAERIRDEIMKNASYGGAKFASAIKTLDDVGLLQQILPEVSKLKEFEHSEPSHPEGGVWVHTLEALKASKSKDPITNLGILLHDVGKAKTRTYNEKGMVQYLGHAVKSAELVEDIGRRLRMSKKEIQALVFVVLNHMKAHDILKMSNSKIWGLLQNENFDILMDVMKADAGARGELFKQDEIEKIVDKIEQVKQKMTPTKYQQIRKLISGNKIMEILDIKPGKELGEIIDKSLTWAVDNSVSEPEQIYQWIKNQYKELVRK